MVELLPLELPELLVAVVKVEMTDGDVKRPLAAARTARWSSFRSSSSDDESDSALLLDRVGRSLRRTSLYVSSFEVVAWLVRETFSFVELLLLTLLEACLCDFFDLLLCLSSEDRAEAILLS
jgi:hypothetical protein